MREAELWAAVEELEKLYGGWVAYLLRRLGQERIRVSAKELAAAMEDFSCEVTREGEDYVIRLRGREEAHGREGCAEPTD